MSIIPEQQNVFKGFGGETDIADMQGWLIGKDYDVNTPAQSIGFNTTDFKNINIPGGGGAAASGGGFMNTMFGNAKTGVGGMAPGLIGLATAGMNTYLGLKQLGVAKDTLKFQKNAFSKQFEAQRSTINTQLRDRQHQRLNAGGNWQSEDDYMKQHGV